MKKKLIIIGLLFFIDPLFSVFDVLPNLIGILLLFFALRNFYYLNSEADNAKKYFLRLIIINAVKLILSVVLIFSNADGIWRLMISSAYVIFNIYYSVLFINHLFTSFDYDFENTGLYIKKTKVLSYFFIIINSVFSILPELTSLSSNQFGVVDISPVRSQYGYIYFLIFIYLIIFIFNIYFYFQILKTLKNESVVSYFNKADNLYIEFNKSHNDILKTKKLLGLLSAIPFASFSFYSLICDGFDIIPNFIPVIFAFIFTFLLLKILNINLKIIIVNIIHTIIALLYSISICLFNLTYFSEYYNESEEGLMWGYSSVLNLYLGKSFPIIRWWSISLVLMIINSIMYIITVIVFIKIIKQNDFIKSFYGLIKSFKSKLVFCFIIYSVMIISDILYYILLPYFPSYWIIDVILKTIFVIFTFYVFGIIKSEILNNNNLNLYSMETQNEY